MVLMDGVIDMVLCGVHGLVGRKEDHGTAHYKYDVPGSSTGGSGDLMLSGKGDGGVRIGFMEKLKFKPELE